MRSMPKTGDVVRYIAMTNEEFEEGEAYRVFAIDSDGDAVVFDKHRRQTCIAPQELANFELVDIVVEDPGYFEVHTAFTADDDELQVVEVTVDKKAFDTIAKFERQHTTAIKVEALKSRIAELQDELNKLQREAK